MDNIKIRELRSRLIAPEGFGFEELGRAACKAAGAKQAVLCHETGNAVLWTKTHEPWPQGSYEGADVEALPGKIEKVLMLFAPSSFFELVETASLRFFRFERDADGVSVRCWDPSSGLDAPVPYGVADAPEWHLFR